MHWSFTAECIFCERELWDIVCGEEKPPSATQTAASHSTFKKRERIAYNDILLATGRAFQAYVRGSKSAYEAWSTLKSQYKDHAGAQRLHLLEQWGSYKKSQSDSMEQHCLKVIEMAEALRSLDEDLSDHNAAMKMLRLPHSWTTFASSLMVPGSTLHPATVQSALVRQEGVRALAYDDAYDEVTAPNKKSGSISGHNSWWELIAMAQWRRPSICEDCGRSGHTKDICWKSHPHLCPTCGNCGKRGHHTKRCRAPPSKGKGKFADVPTMLRLRPASRRMRMYLLHL